MTISKKDYELLKELQKKASYINTALSVLLDKWEQQRQKDNQKNYERIKAKRKTNKNYARSQTTKREFKK